VDRCVAKERLKAESSATDDRKGDRGIAKGEMEMARSERTTKSYTQE